MHMQGTSSMPMKMYEVRKTQRAVVAEAMEPARYRVQVQQVMRNPKGQ